ncbi:MAG TPA: hypothetical protein VD997_10860 [Phycisphaerales bacterium]|nr:hypothetical protein [Phycisphaerales bacterium]
MIKLMRKNRKILLAVFGAGLMVMFLLSGPQSIFQPDPTKAVVATVAGREVKAGEMGKYNSEYQAMKQLSAEVVERLQIENGEHWMLLTEEAKRAGLVGATGIDSRMSLFEQIAQVQLNRAMQMGMLRINSQGEFNKAIDNAATNLEQQIKPRIAGQLRMSEEEFDRAVAKLHGVIRLRGQFQGAVRVSEKRSIAEVQKQYDAVVADGLVIPAEKISATMPEPTEEQVQAQFAQYKDVKPGTGEFGFGYVQPARVRFEYLVIDRNKLKALVKPDPVRVSKEYQKNRAKYTGDEATETPRVEADIVNTMVDQLIADAERIAAARLKTELRTLPVEGGKRKLPTDWDQRGLRLSGLAEALREGFKAQGYEYTPEVVVRNEAWTKVRELMREPGIGTAYFRTGTSSGDLRRLADSMSELNAQSGVPFQAKVPFETPLADMASGNRYYVNVLDWRAESPADSLEEVRGDVVRDLKLKAAYDQLVRQLDDLKSQAISSGLDAVAAQYPTPAPLGATDPTPKPLPVFRYATVTRDSATGELNAKEVRDAVVAKAQQLGVKMVATPENLPERTVAVAVPSKLSVAVVQILGHRPATQELMRTVSRGMVDQFAMQELREHNENDPFSFEALRARYDYKAVDENEGKKQAS